MKKNSILKVGSGIAVGLTVGKMIRDYSNLDRKSKINKLYKNWAWFYDSFLSPWNFLLASGAERDLHNYLTENMKGKLDILDVACGTGVNYARTKELGLKVKSYKGIDLSAEMLGIARKKATGDKKVEFVIQDLFTFKPEKKFDLIYSTWTFSHFKNQHKIVEQYLKYLKKDGKLVVIFQTRPAKFKLISNITDKIMEFFEAKLVPLVEVEKLEKHAVVSEQYVQGYIRMMVLGK